MDIGIFSSPRTVAGRPVCVTDDEAGARERAGADAVAGRIAEVGAAGATTLVAAEFGTPDERGATRALLRDLDR